MAKIINLKVKINKTSLADSIVGAYKPTWKDVKGCFNSWILNSQIHVFDDVEVPGFIYDETITIHQQGKPDIAIPNNITWIIIK